MSSELYTILSQYYSPLLLLTISAILFLFSTNLPPSLSYDLYSTCNTRFSCGNITNVGFPFWGGLRNSRSCGIPELELYCETSTVTKIKIRGVTYNVEHIDQRTQILTLSPPNFLNETCRESWELWSDNFGSTVFEYGSDSGGVTVFHNCSKPLSSAKILSCEDGIRYVLRSGEPEAESNCSYTSVIYGVTYDENRNVSDFVAGRFDLKYSFDAYSCGACIMSEGVCGYNGDYVTCYCQTPSAGDTECPASNAVTEPHITGLSSKSNWGIGIAAALSGITFIFILILCYCKRNLAFFKKDKREEFDVEAFIRSYGSFSPKRYSYSNIKKMTNSFAEKIGKGGYGAVFKGKLPNGFLVAVKVLSNSKGNGEEFINEVASIGRTSHVNVVTLLGFCYEGKKRKRALIYEYMPNGSLDKFIFRKESMDTNCGLDWKKLYDISIGIARGLEYLHRGCNTRILHFDIKPHNILLDKNFCPKISDFGLSKLCQMDESNVSLLGTRGTAGYIAPEVFCRSFGGVSYKSDVYSYGMMVFEMVGGRKNIEVGVSRTSEIYFPDWLRKHIEEDENLKLNVVMSTQEEEIVRKMILVSLWCTQTMPSDRPSMTKVVEMLEGSLQSLQIPPKSSTTELPTHSSASSS